MDFVPGNNHRTDGSWAGRACSAHDIHPIGSKPQRSNPALHQLQCSDGHSHADHRCHFHQVRTQKDLAFRCHYYRAFASLAGFANNIWTIIGLRGLWGIGNSLLFATGLTAIITITGIAKARSILLFEAAVG